MTTLFLDFHQAFPPDAGHDPFNPARHDSFAGKVPPAILNEWRHYGFGSYGNGILWTVAPDEPFLDPADWPGLDGTGIEILRSAFGDVCLWQGGRFIWVNVLSGTISKYSDDAKIVFLSLTGPKYRQNVLLEPLLDTMRDRFGPLGKDECYGFSPLSSRGPIDESQLIKTQMRDYVAKAGQRVC